MLTPIKTFQKYKEYSLNAYKHNISNARVKSKTQKIKLITRVAFGIKNFKSLRNKIFYIQAIENARKATNNAVYASQFV